MKNHTKGFTTILLAAIITLLIISGAVYFYSQNQDKIANINGGVVATSTIGNSVATSTATTTIVQITIAVPKDAKDYEKKTIAFTNGDTGQKDIYSALTDADFSFKTIPVDMPSSYTLSDVIRKSAELSVEQTTLTQIPIKVIDFKIVGDDSYVELNIDVDAWAGVTYTINNVRPLVRKTLLQFPSIKNVYFGAQYFE